MTSLVDVQSDAVPIGYAVNEDEEPVPGGGRHVLGRRGLEADVVRASPGDTHNLQLHIPHAMIRTMR